MLTATTKVEFIAHGGTSTKRETKIGKKKSRTLSQKKAV